MDSRKKKKLTIETIIWLQILWIQIYFGEVDELTWRSIKAM